MRTPLHLSQVISCFLSNFYTRVTFSQSIIVMKHPSHATSGPSDTVVPIALCAIAVVVPSKYRPREPGHVCETRALHLNYKYWFGLISHRGNREHTAN